MKLKVIVCLIGFAFFFGAAAQAQERQTIDLSVAYSYVRYNPATSGVKDFSMNGASASVAYNFNGWLSGVADFGGYSKHNILGNGVSGTLSTYLFGPRISLNRSGRITPFAQILLRCGARRRQLRHHWQQPDFIFDRARRRYRLAGDEPCSSSRC